MKMFRNITAAVFALCLIPAGMALASGMNFSLPEVKKAETGSGVKLFYIKDELPKTVIYVSVGYGRIYENSQNAGTGDILAGTLKHSGSKKYPGQKLYSVLENIGGEISISSGWENTYISIEVLSKYTDLAYDILKDLLQNPLLSEESLAFSKKSMKDKLKRNLDDPEYRAFLKVREIIYGGSGYGAVMTDRSIEDVKVENLKSVWKRYFVSGNMNIAVSSSEGFESVEKGISSATEKVPSGPRTYYTVDNKNIKENIERSRGKIYLIPMKLKQATIVKGTVAPDNRYEGRYALDVMNYILGGGSFTSRLMSEVRVKRGYAYSVFSLVRNRYKTGIFLSFAQTRNSNVGDVLKLFDDIFRDMYTAGVSDSEVKRAVDSIKNSYVFSFVKTSQIVSNFLELEYNGFDETYFNRYLKGISEVSGGNVAEECRKLLSGGTITVIAGDESLKAELSKLGDVVVVK